MRRELASVRDSGGNRLTAIARRFPAIDARYCVDQPDDELRHEYSLADQLFVDPCPLPSGMGDAASFYIEMSQQEAAVARSHIAVWKLIAEGAPPYTLVLEDDAYLRWGFGRTLDRAWVELGHLFASPPFDLLYLSYQEARQGADVSPVSLELMRPLRGLWHLSGYVLSKRGAQRLLSLLPVSGPVDLWINHQFEKLDVLATRRPIVKQRLDLPSSNSYSVLPILSKVGALTREKPPTLSSRALPTPILAFGRQGTGLTSLAMALSMLGYRCCSDVAALPDSEHRALLGNQRTRVFDAYANVGTLRPHDLIKLMKAYPHGRFIVTAEGEHTLGLTAADLPHAATTCDAEEARQSDSARALLDQLRSHTRRVLVLPADYPDKWQLLTQFLVCDYPGHRYPECTDQGQRALLGEGHRPQLPHLPRAARLKWDALPWVADRPEWHGLALEEVGDAFNRKPSVLQGGERFESLDTDTWRLRDDTFPSNMALFSPANFEIIDDSAVLTFREEHVVVRDYTSAALSSRNAYRYGRFTAELKPPAVAGLITGLFLHRNSPRQEIDIEFLGNDTTKLLVNVFYNPGYEGAKVEYGYRGTPALIELGFNAADDFHRYEIDWTPTAIRWRIDGRLLHCRLQWDPTPIPHLPMQFQLNVWHSRSTALAGKLARARLPAHAELRRIEIHA
jgi:GR25 family glycosyltransferase involved in LPS biosynthesis